MTLPFGTAPVDPAPVWTAECLLPAVGASVAEARALVRRELGRWGLHELIDDCSLIVSELTSNVVRHGGNVFTLRLGSNGTWVYGEVYDQGEGLPRQREADIDSVGGRGLMIVDELADDWGVARSSRGGKTVWFLAGTGSPSMLPVVPYQSRIAVG
ncbi:MAG: ATP-binding protein [Microbispora sp.]|nr:ATP-binding protein [Microbispora sp.]